jgi:hypothetical protein
LVAPPAAKKKRTTKKVPIEVTSFSFLNTRPLLI